MDTASVENVALEPLEARIARVLARRRAASRPDIPSIDLCGVRVDNLDLRGVLRSVCMRISQREPGYIVTPNVDHICTCHTDPDFRDAYEHAFLSLADGKPLLWAGRLLKTPLREKLSGSDLIYRLSAFAAGKGYSIYLMGAAEGVGAEAARRLAARYAGLRVAGVDSPPLGFEKDAAVNAAVVERLRQSQADICFVALGSPKQEVWMRRNIAASAVPVMIGVGASFEFVAGVTRRAPVWMQQSGLEWFWRLCLEPRRLWRRYLVRDTRFFLILGRYLAMRYGPRFRRAAGS